jgi:hypothetical protein
MKTIQLGKKFAVLISALILTSAALGSMLTQMYFPQLGKIAGQLEDPLEAWSEASYVVWQYNSTYYACRNMSTNIVNYFGTSDDAAIQWGVDRCTLHGGSVYVKAPTYTGTYSASVTLKDNVTLILDKGARGITVTIDSGADSTLVDYENGYRKEWVAGVLYTFMDLRTGKLWWQGQNRTDTLAFPEQTASYIVFVDGGVYKAKNGSTGQIDYSSTNATYILHTACVNGKSVYVKYGIYQLGIYGLVLPTSTEIIGENNPIFNYSGTDWAIKTVNTAMDTGVTRIKDVTVNIDGAYVAGCKGGILLQNMTDGLLEDVSVIGGGSPVGTTAGIKIAGTGGNTVILRSCEVSGFAYGYWVTADWVLLEKCNSYTSNTAFFVDNEGGTKTRPIETQILYTLAYHPDYCGYNISYATEFSLIQPAYEGENGNDATAFAFDNGDGDTTVRGYFAYPTFHDYDPKTFYDFSNTLVLGTQLMIPSNIEHFRIENCGETTVAHNEWVPHGLGDTPVMVSLTCATAVYGNPSRPIIVSVKDWNATKFKVGVYWANGTYIMNDAIIIEWYARVF